MNAATITTRQANIRIRAARAKLVAQVEELVSLSETYQYAGMQDEAIDLLKQARAIQSTRLYQA